MKTTEHVGIKSHSIESTSNGRHKNSAKPIDNKAQREQTRWFEPNFLTFSSRDAILYDMAQCEIVS